MCWNCSVKRSTTSRIDVRSRLFGRAFLGEVRQRFLSQEGFISIPDCRRTYGTPIVRVTLEGQAIQHVPYPSASMYFTPLPVLNNTTRSSLASNPDSVSRRAAAKVAPPSGAAKTPVFAAISFAAAIIS